MKQRVVPTFTNRGFVKNTVAERVDFILAYFFETAPSQNWLHQRSTQSVQALLQKHQHDIDGFVSEVTNVLQENLKKYFTQALVQITYKNHEEYVQTGRADLVLTAVVEQDGITYNVGREFTQIKGVFQMVANEINYGA